MAQENGPTCYNPDNSIATGYTACNASANHSSCCHNDAYCLDNGYCFIQQLDSPHGTKWSNHIGRGACTDRSWTDPACPYWCKDVIGSDKSNTYMWQAQDADISPVYNYLCCGAAYNQSSSACPIATQGQNDRFVLSSGAIIYNRTDGSIMKNGTLDEAALPTVTVHASPESQQPQCVSTLPIAAGLAVPLGVMLLASLVIIFILLRKLRAMKQQIQSSSKLGIHEPVAATYENLNQDHASGGKPEALGVYEAQSNPRDELPAGREPVEIGPR